MDEEAANDGNLTFGDGDACARDSTFELLGGLCIDASTRLCNEFAYANDFRTDLKKFDDPLAQLASGGYPASPNCRAVCVWIKPHTGPASDAATWHAVPRVAIVTCRAINACEEITLDYGNQYWGESAKEALDEMPELKRQQVQSSTQTISLLPRFARKFNEAEARKISRESSVYKLLASQLHRSATRHRRPYDGPLHHAPQFSICQIDEIVAPRLQDKYLSELRDIAAMSPISAMRDDSNMLRVQSFNETDLDLNEFLLFHGTYVHVDLSIT
jgi:hypothetical protein